MSSMLARDVRGKEVASERQRTNAVQQLDRFATGAILEPLLLALDDSSPQVRREALRLCYEREVVACIPGATALWSDGPEPTVRVAALKVLALDPEASRVGLLIDALRDPSELIRAQAADFLGTAPLPPSVRRRVRSALLTKLADVAVTVRRRAVLSLGRLGPGEGTLSIARLLDDPEPTVRAAAAEALALYRDATAVPSLRRAIAAPNEALVARALIDALAVLPDPSVEADLLALLDEPPAGLDEMQLAHAIGRRPSPGPSLIEGLVERLDEPLRQPAVLLALLALGEHARAALEQARRRGLAPATDVEVRRLLAALDPIPALPAAAAWPAAEDRAGWQHHLEDGDAIQRRRAAWALADQDPPWRVSAALAVLERPGPVAGRRAWVMTLAASPRPYPAAYGTAIARLEGWSRDPRLSTTDRCLCITALGAQRTIRRRVGRGVPPPWADLAADPDPQIRACTALALGRRGDRTALAGLLVDDRARVRAAAALALAEVDPGRWERGTAARLAIVATRDPAAPVRAAASRTLDLRVYATSTPAERPGRFMRRSPAYPWRDPVRWIEVDEHGRPLWLPAQGSGPWRWTVVPGLAAAEPRGETEP